MPRTNATKPVPPTTKDVATAAMQPAPNQPDTASVQVPGGFAKQGPQDNMNDTTYHQPDVNSKGVEPAVNNLENQLQALLGSDLLKQLIDAGVREQIDRLGLNAPVAETKTVVQKPEFHFLKHYRNDTSPELQIPELDMSADIPQLAPTGKVIRFRRGHFFAVTENQVAQLDWMKDNAELSHDTTQVVGGNRAIYEDDGEVLYYCTAGCSKADFVSASKEKYKAHMRSVHGIEI